MTVQRILSLVIAGATMTAACVNSGSNIPIGSTTTIADTAVEPSTTRQAEPDTTTTHDTLSDVQPTPLVVRRLVVTGPEEIVFDWTTDRCEDEHIPDIAPRAFRDADGLVQLNIGHYVNYRMTGPDLDTLASDCTAPVMETAFDPDPSQFNDS